MTQLERTNASGAARTSPQPPVVVLSDIETALNAGGNLIPKSQFDLVLANPPYFSHYKIAELFLKMSHRVLKPGSLVHVVTKTPNWFAEKMPMYFQEVGAEQVKEYWVLSGVR